MRRRPTAIFLAPVVATLVAAGCMGSRVDRTGSTSRADGGAGGSGGAGGAGGASCSSFDACQALCGNGKRDTCAYRTLGGAAGSGDGECVEYTEACDGTDLGDDSCAAHGFGSGTIACSSCGIDTSRCSLCAPDPSLARCEVAAFSASPINAAIGATDAEVGVAWIELNTSGQPVLGFARLAPSLDVMASSRFEDPALAAALPRSSQWDAWSAPLSVAPLASGWAIAGYAIPELYIHAVSASGADLGRTSVATFSSDDLQAAPLLVARPTGGPLLLWQQAGVLRAAVVADDGRSISEPKDIYVQDPSALPFVFESATYAGDAFYIAVQSPPASSAFQLLRVQSDGTPSGAVDVHTDVAFDLVILAAGAGDLRVLLNGLEPPMGCHFQRFDLGGAPAAPAAVITADYYWPMSAVAFGDDTVALVARTDAASNLHMAVTRVGPSGQVVTPAHEILAGFWSGAIADGFARRGPDVIAAPVLDQASQLIMTRVIP